MEPFKGTSVNDGVVFGPVKYYDASPPAVDEAPVEDRQAELARYHAARAKAVARLGQLHDDAAARLGAENALLFEIHQMMLEDLDYTEAIEHRITEDGQNAGYAVWQTAEEFSGIFLAMDDEYMQARASDVKDVSIRLLDILAGRGERTLATGSPVIIVAEDLMPSETAQLDLKNTLGIATAKGSINSHTAIFARSMGIPAAIGLGAGITAALDGRQAALDAGAGVLYIEPDATAKMVLEQKRREFEDHTARLRELAGKPTETQDGRKVMLYANIGSPADLPLVLENDAEGIGLFRSEFLYLGRDDFPSEEEQFNAYREVAEKMQGKRVIIRTLDIGADKQAAYFGLPAEENPALGMRAIRICLARPSIFHTQLRALYRASAFGKIAIMFPMIISAEEVRRAKAAAQAVQQELRSENIPFDEKVEIGIMVETPAAAILSDVIAPMVDFFSIGTNDLTQYTLACDRQNSSLDEFCDIYSEAVLRQIETTCKNAHAAGIWCGICGELAADETLTERFLKMGIDELSVAPPLVLGLRKLIREVRSTEP